MIAGPLPASSPSAPPPGYEAITELSDEFERPSLDTRKWSTDDSVVGWKGRPPGLFRPCQRYRARRQTTAVAHAAMRNASWPPSTTTPRLQSTVWLASMRASLRSAGGLAQRHQQLGGCTTALAGPCGPRSTSSSLRARAMALWPTRALFPAAHLRSRTRLPPSCPQSVTASCRGRIQHSLSHVLDRVSRHLPIDFTWQASAGRPR